MNMKILARNANILLAFVAIAATGFAQGPPAVEANINPAVLKVNGDVVYAADISMVMQNIAGQMGGRDKVEDEQQLVQMATQRLVEQKLLSQEAARLGIQPNEPRVTQMSQAIERQAGGRDVLDASLAQMGSNYDQVVKMIREMDLVRSLIEQKISPSIQISDEEVKAFYDENPQLFEAEEQVRARHIIFNATLDADTQTTAEARAKAEDAHRRALAGEDFAELARVLSEGPAAPNGGELPPFTREQTAPQFAAAAFALEPGGISPVVRTDFGFHVIKVEEKRPAGTLPLDEVSDHLHSLLEQQRTGEEVAKMVEALADTATITPLAPPGSKAAGGTTPQ
jgi:peptidyl-prolyl cis-trans isomerase C